MKIIISGGRDYKDGQKVFDILNALMPYYVVVGDCPTGVDHFVLEWCKQNNVLASVHDENFFYRVYYADWDKHGRAAGPLRNRDMCQENIDALLLLSFPGGAGTKNCVTEAKKLGILVLKVDE